MLLILANTIKGFKIAQEKKGIFTMHITRCHSSRVHDLAGWAHCADLEHASVHAILVIRERRACVLILRNAEVS